MQKMDYYTGHLLYMVEKNKFVYITVLLNIFYAIGAHWLALWAK